MSDAPSDREPESAAERPARISEQLVRELRACAARGESIAALARLTGFSENAVRRAVRGRRGNLGGAHKGVQEGAVEGRGESGRPPTLSAERVRAILRDLAGGKDRATVARAHGVSRSYVSRLRRGDARLDVDRLPATDSSGQSDAVDAPEGSQ